MERDSKKGPSGIWLLFSRPEPGDGLRIDLGTACQDAAPSDASAPINPMVDPIAPLHQFVSPLSASSKAEISGGRSSWTVRQRISRLMLK
jgi:hypothetical protein